MNQASQSEYHQIIAELKAILAEALQILRGKEEPLQNDAIRARAKEQGGA
jgi:hypothetical protein